MFFSCYVRLFHVKHFFVNHFLFCTDFFQTKNLENARIVAVSINCEKIFRLCSIVSRETFFRFSVSSRLLFSCSSHSFLDATVASVLISIKYNFYRKRRRLPCSLCPRQSHARSNQQADTSLYAVIIEHYALLVSCAQNLFFKHKGKLRPCAFLYLPEGFLPFEDNIHKKSFANVKEEKHRELVL